MAPLPTVMTKKTIERLGSNLNEKAAGSVSDFARKQLEKYGWKEGQGLGKKEDGIVEHLKINKKQDDGGLGIERVQKEKREETNVWWHDAFSGALGTINIGTKKDKKSKKKRKAEDQNQPEDEGDSLKKAPPSFDELFKATGGARLGMRARRKQKGKLERSERKLKSDEEEQIRKKPKQLDDDIDDIEPVLVLTHLKSTSKVKHSIDKAEKKKKKKEAKKDKKQKDNKNCQ